MPLTSRQDSVLVVVLPFIDFLVVDWLAIAKQFIHQGHLYLEPVDWVEVVTFAVQFLHLVLAKGHFVEFFVIE